ncbi:MAG: (Rhomboid family) [Rickettsiaceae bacterium]|jgi:putative oxidoreductase|nr:(Rhomboid family) [Rickettsiaceae bacterium]
MYLKIKSKLCQICNSLPIPFRKKQTKCEHICSLAKDAYGKYINFVTTYLSSALLLAMRIWMGLIFFKSGMTKISNFDQATVLFEYEYQLPLLSPYFAAVSSTIFEVGCGALIIVGLATRLSVLPLIIMTIVIQSLVFQNPEHFYWLFLLSTLAIYGGGKLSADQICAKFCNKK